MNEYLCYASETAMLADLAIWRHKINVYEDEGKGSHKDYLRWQDWTQKVEAELERRTREQEHK